MLVPMVLARPDRAWSYAALTTITSVLGGVAGYLIGMFLFEELGRPLITFYQAQDGFAQVKNWFDRYGIWVVFVAGFSPIPYKLFTVTSGVMSLAWAPFLFASLVGRGARFFLVAGLIYLGGERFSRFLQQRVEQIGWTVVALAAIVVVVLQFV
jgi:membrane protein YqaA with SNARE-associated domain